MPGGQHPEPGRNWAGNLRYAATAIHRPSSVPELQELIACAERVRALGTRHSFSAVADSPGVLVALDRLAPDVTIDPAAMTATVGAGTTYGALADRLEASGYALHNMGSLPHISVAGATATGTHGSGDGNGILATAIAAVELVTADGSLHTVDRSSADLPAIAVGLGAFGVITRLTLDIRPSYLVRQDVYRGAPWDTVLAELDEVMASAYSVSLMTGFDGPVVWWIWQKTRVDAEWPAAGGPPAVASRFGGSWDDDANLPVPNSLNTRAGIPGPWSQRLPHFRLDAPPSVGGDELQTEYFVGREHGAAALRVLRSLGAQIAPHLHAAEIRTVAADELWLSPAYRRDCLAIGFTWRRHPAEVDALLAVIQDALRPFEPRPHWGKLFRVEAELSPLFPRLPDFLRLAGRYDPLGKFWNPFLHRVLEGGRSGGG
jgi:xylitol oxidase